MRLHGGGVGWVRLCRRSLGVWQVSLSLPSFGTTSGFQGSERTEVQVALYNKAGSAYTLYNSGRTVIFDGRPQDGVPSVVSCQVSNTLGQGGSFNFSVKAPLDFAPLETFAVDAWVDISFRRFTKTWHVMRGMIDEVRYSRQAGPGGTRVTVQVSGRSFQKAWSTTRVFMNALAADNVAGGLAFKVTPSGLANQDPRENVELVLFKLFDVIGARGQNWGLPADMPGPGGTLSQAVQFDAEFFNPYELRRFTPTGTLLWPDVMIWDLAANQYADGQFCELFTEILPVGGMSALAADPDMSVGLSPSVSRMTAVFRDKPFPLVDPVAQGLPGLTQPYFHLPTWQLNSQDVVDTQLGTSSFEALNAFSFVGNYSQERTSQNGTVRSILERADDKATRGTRRMDVTTPYSPNVASGTSILGLNLGLRARLKDWYCLGAELAQGTLGLGRSYPQMRVGGRVKVKGSTSAENLTAYIEGVSHQWRPGSCSTSLDITRAYFGSDADHLARLATVSGAFTEAKVVKV